MPGEHFVTATLWEYIMPLDRGDRYEDPLDEALSAQGLGETCGGGSMMSEDYGIEFVDIEIKLTDLTRGLSVVANTLTSQGAPRGSVLRYSRNGEEYVLEFGVAECLAIVLDGTTLPDEVYEATDINDMIEAMVESIGENGELRSWWEGPVNTVLFFFGLDAEELFSAMQPVIASHERCQNAQLVIRHGNEKLSPRIVQMPRQA